MTIPAILVLCTSILHIMESNIIHGVRDEDVNNLGHKEIQDRRHNEGVQKVPADESDTDEGAGASDIIRSRKCKARRARRKAYRPYYQLSEGERTMREENERMRLVRLRDRMRAKGRIIAPYNTTQFLLADHHDDTVQQLEKNLESRIDDQKNDDLKGKNKDNNEENYYNSSPTDEEEDFVSKEFMKDYDIQHINRLEKMSKEILLNEFMIIERKNEDLEARLENIRQIEEEKARLGQADYEFHRGEVPMEPEMAQKIRIFQNEINILKAENLRLIKENRDIKDRIRQCSASSCSSSSSSSSSSSDDCDDDTEDEIKEKNSSLPEDTGYESTQSKDGHEQRADTL